ncbi:LysM peptidoglycan-binding domain-containing protein [Microbacterium hydrothermale]|uniref:LysM peptidoglycan-binding domain-containing protein n=1 Tax=Microbacterium hydrothermale TaxID=857427 RepID=UPI0010A83588|nr:LysM domain-containing protein [Microbacterium hydrothermale]
MRRLTLSPLPARRSSAWPAAAVWPAAVAGTIALSLTGESAAHAAPPAPALTVTPPVPRTVGAPIAVTKAVATAVTASTYTVQPGDTVWAIARARGLDPAAVAAANGLGADAMIRPGQVLALTAAAAAPTAPAPAPAPAPATTTHEVRPGDTVSAIARANGVSLDAVLSANGLTRASIIYPGDILRIPSGTDSGAPAPAALPAPTAPGLDAEQSENARLIIRVGRELGVSDRGILIALGTAMQESWLRNLDWGDRDSLGLFQQRPSAGWGTPEQIRDPERSTRVFYGGAGDPNGAATRGLLDIPGWETLAYADAAQAVQISAYPDRYAQWEQPATTWLAVLG